MAYQDGDTLAVVHMSNTNGLIEDEFVNTFAFRQSLAPDEADYLEMVELIDQFYNDLGASGNRVSGWISEAVSRAVTHRIDFYKIQAGPLGSPAYEAPWLGPAAPLVANSNLPTEVAAVLSFHGDLTGVLEEVGTTRPKARRRGRIYLGPLTTGAVYITDDRPLVNAPFLLAVREAAVRLMDNSLTDSHLWSVWSREAADLYPVVGGWTDDACDTQRRRGNAAGSRVVWG